MSKGSISKKNSEMAKYLARMGIRRTSAACPICHKSVSLKALYHHIVGCRG